MGEAEVNLGAAPAVPTNAWARRARLGSTSCAIGAAIGSWLDRDPPQERSGPRASQTKRGC